MYILETKWFVRESRHVFFKSNANIERIFGIIKHF